VVSGSMYRADNGCCFVFPVRDSEGIMSVRVVRKNDLAAKERKKRY